MYQVCGSKIVLNRKNTIKYKSNFDDKLMYNRLTDCLHKI